MADDFLYANAPLVEVIAEIHWKLEPIQAIPNAAIDPHRSVFETDFATACADQGFQLVERTVPDEVPREILAHQITKRYRKAPGAWPLYQTGPGVLAMNIVPPYKGWREFASFISEGINLLLLSYPMPDRYLTIEKLHLRYIDAFASEHGVVDRSDFVQTDLGFVKPLPQRIRSYAAKVDEPIVQTAESTISLTKPNHSKAVIKIDSGKRGNEKAVIATFVVENARQAPQDRDGITNWFDESHLVVHDFFDAMLSDRVKALMGPREVIK